MLRSFGRTVDYLRISVTDFCDLQCRYCVRDPPPRRLAHDECLRYEEIAEVVRVFMELGGRKVRLTGGEPLLKPQLAVLIRLLAELPRAPELTLTTNGTCLAEQAAALYAAGLQRVNISLDTLCPETFVRLTGHDKLAAVVRGIDQALACGLTPIRVNAVVLRGVNDGELAGLVTFAGTRGLELRFIEQMRLPGSDAIPVSGEEIRDALAEQGYNLVPLPVVGAATAVSYCCEHPGEYGGPLSIGFINTRTSHMCGRCSRLRLSPDGRLRPCLFSPEEIDIRTPLREGRDIRPFLRAAIERKPRSGISKPDSVLPRAMVETGG